MTPDSFESRLIMSDKANAAYLLLKLACDG
jgi:hypothetical protein